MRSRRWIYRSPLLVACALAISVVLGCGTHPIPRVAVSGTTITIPVPDWFGAGFGRALNEELDPSVENLPDPVPLSPTLDDNQRGELLFVLSKTGAFVSYLPIRYITRVQLDEGSPAATPAPGEIPAARSQGQVLALVDIPLGIPSDDYSIVVKRMRRSEATPTSFVEDPPTTVDPGGPWYGWAQPDPQQGIPIRIVDEQLAGTIFTPTSGWDLLFGAYTSDSIADDLPELVPRPKLQIRVQDLYTGVIPAAWELQVAYTRGKIEVLGVEIDGNHRSGGIVSWSGDPEVPSSCSEMGTFKLLMANPGLETESARIVYRLRDFASCGRAVAGDFSIVFGSLRSYDMDGVPLTGVGAFVSNQYSFR